MFLQGDTKKKKWEYFKDYYLRTAILCGIFIFAGIHFLYSSFFGYRKTAIDILIVESAELKLNQITAGLEDVLDTEGEEIVIEQLSKEAALSQTILPARIAAGDIDLLIADRQTFQELAKKGIMEELQEVLPDELYEKIEGRLIYGQIQEIDVHGNVMASGQERPMGIGLRKLDHVKEIETAMADPVLGILKGTDDLEMELDVIRFFMK